jgi:hypothetical protein
MLSSDANLAEHWRALAIEALEIADQMSDPDAEEVMWRLAMRYERMAKQAERPSHRYTQPRPLPIGFPVLPR